MNSLASTAGIDLPLTPPLAERPRGQLGFFRRIQGMRENTISTWSQKAYEVDLLRGSFLGKANFILNTPDTIRHVLLDNYENYTRTPAAFRVLRPILGDGLLIAEGKAWKHQRRTLAPAFTPRAVSHLTTHMADVVEETVAELEPLCGRPVNLREIMQQMTLEIAGRTMFSFQMQEQGPELRAFVMEYGSRLAKPHFLDIALPPGWPTPQDFQRAKFRKRWTHFVAGLIARRRAAGKTEGAPPRDLFDLMESARDPETGAAFSDAALGDEVATMILAGHETTATALFWTLYMLSLDQRTQQAVADEAKGVVASGVEDLARLPLTRAVIDETMRLYPPAFLIARAATAADTLGDQQVNPGDAILISPWLLHRHEKLWDQPNAFIPARFMPGAPAVDRFAYLPFGAGPRVCIGAQFALVEAVLALSRLIGKFKVSLRDTRPVLPVGVVTTQPDHAPMFEVTLR